MPGLTAFGVFHTAIGVIALIYGFIALVRDKEISPSNRRGQIYLVTTLITAVTALGIFRHGGFGPPHALAVLTLVALAVGTVPARPHAFRWAPRDARAPTKLANILRH